MLLLLKGVWKELPGSFVVGRLGVLFRGCFVGRRGCVVVNGGGKGYS